MRSRTSQTYGRTQEVEAAVRALEEAGAGRGTTVLVEGEPGIGKTRLVDDLLSSTATTAFVVARGRAEQLERERPFGLFVDAFRDPGRSDPRLSELSDRLRGGGTDVSGTSSFRLVDDVVDAVETLSLDRPVLVALEDLHWADASSLLTVVRLVRSVRRLPVCLVLTARPGPRSYELDQMVETVASEGGLHLSLGPLDEASVRTLLAELTGAEPDAGLVSHVAACGGNPLFVTELVGALVADRRIQVEDGCARIVTTSLPPPLRLTILRRLSFLSAPALEALRMASVLGSVFSPADLAVVLGRSTLDVASVVAEASEVGILGEHGDRLAFRHDLVRDSVYTDIPLAVRKSLHLEAGRALARSGSEAWHVAAHMSIGAQRGDHEAVSWLRRAADEAVLKDPVVAADLLSRAADLLPPTDPQRAKILADRAVALIWCGRLEEAEALAREGLHAHPPFDAEWQLRGALSRSLSIQGRQTEAIDALEPLSARPEVTPPLQALLLALRCYPRLLSGDAEGATREAHDALELAQRHRTPLAASTAYYTLWAGSYFRGFLDDAIRFARACVEAGSRHEGRYSPFSRSLPYDELGLTLAEADRFREAEQVVAEGRRLLDGSLTYLLPTSHYLLNVKRFFAGEWDDAVADLEAGLATADEFGISLWRALGCSVLARIAVHRGDNDRARALLEVVNSDARERGLSLIELYISMWVKSLLAEATGAADQALVTLGSAWSMMTSLGLLVHCRLLGPDLIRLHLAAGDADAARATAVVVEEAAARAGDIASARGVALRCRGMAEGDADVLVRAVEEYRSSGRPVETAFAMEDAGAALGPHGSDLLREALDLLHGVGATREERRVEARLRALGMRRGARGTRRRPTTGWEALTRTESRVVDLVCEGLTNRQVAERLYVSRRTVDTHLAHVFQKLGITSRTELVTRAARHRA